MLAKCFAIEFIGADVLEQRSVGQLNALDVEDERVSLPSLPFVIKNVISQKCMNAETLIFGIMLFSEHTNNVFYYSLLDLDL